MKTYREFSSLADALGFSGKALYSVTNHVSRHYKPVQIGKKNGEMRQLYVPDNFLKAIQKSILVNLLAEEAVSPYATAYRAGSGPKQGARVHVGKPTVLKLDIRHFFDRVIYPQVKEKVFDAQRYSEQNRVLLSLLCVYRDALPQGAPTSPAISNIIMRDFDNTVGAWCEQRHIAYTRYCDDMTFSGDFDPAPVIEFVQRELRKMGFFLNDKKTVVARRGQRQCVTGIVVNERVGVPAEYKQRIRQEVYYCQRFGIESHLAAIGSEVSADTYLRKLLGRVNYVLSVEPHNRAMQTYRSWLLKQMKA